MTGRPPLSLALAVLLLLSAAPPGALGATPEQQLTAATRAYGRSDFDRVVELVRPLLYPKIRLSSQRQVIRAYKLLGISYVFLKQREQASKQFLAILALEPTFRLDPLVDPVAAVEVFDDVKRRNAEKIRAILERERRQAEQRRQEELRRQEEARRRAQKNQRPPLVIERTIHEHPYWLNFLPLGVGQFQNGHRTKGFLLLGGQLALAAVSLGTGVAVYTSYANRPLSADEYDRARALSIAQVTSGGLCAALIAYGIIDALVYHQPRTVRERRHRARSALRITPSLAPGGGQLGLTVTF